uniref:Uncharacterized protein n=1 Tax=Setaria viridis TaxID=4556 RepID=A0A4U6TI66_SETVI|nr:hypothetical protein SEVIR_8G138350v2 [Setaria viridis]
MALYNLLTFFSLSCLRLSRVEHLLQVSVGH